MISDEVGAFMILRNYLVGIQFYSLSLQTKLAVFLVMVSGWRNVQVQQQQKFNDGPLTNNMEGQRVIP